MRKKVLVRDHYKCRAKDCKRIATVVHHARYAKEEFTEPIEWLYSLCEKCHNLFHKHTKGYEKRKLWINTMIMIGKEETLFDGKIIKLKDDWRLSKSATKSRNLNGKKKKTRRPPKYKPKPIKFTSKKTVKSKRGAGTPKGAEALYEARREKKRQERLNNL